MAEFDPTFVIIEPPPHLYFTIKNTTYNQFEMLDGPWPETITHTLSILIN